MLNHFTFNGQSSADYGLLVTGVKIYDAPSRVVEEVQIPGRNGNIIFDLGNYNNITIGYDVCIIDNFKANARNIAAWLLGSSGYLRLTDTYDTTIYRLACCSSAIEYATTALDQYGKATIEFNCYPQRFLVEGDDTYYVTGNTDWEIENPTTFDAKPIIRAHGTGTFAIGDYEVTITTNSNYIDINCETMQCYCGDTNCNNNVELDEFPVLKPGINHITYGGVTVDITPKWWVL